jgi:hypothetical protein
MSLAEAMSLDKPENGWFIPNCEDGTLFFSSQSIEQRKNVEIPLFVTGDKQNVLQVILFIVESARDVPYGRGRKILDQ